MSTIESLSLQETNNIYQRQTAYYSKIISTVQAETYPYRFLEVENLFSDEFYAYLKLIMPRSDELRSLSELMRTTGGSKSYPEGRFCLPIIDFTRGAHYLDEVVKDKRFNHLIMLYKWLRYVFLPEIFKKLNVDFSRLYQMEVLYCEDHSGYVLHPHNDLESKIVSVLTYMPDDDSQVGEGTRILDPKNPSKHGNKNLFWPESDFNLVRAAKYKPNNTFAFARASNSFHSVARVPEGMTRKLLMVTATAKRK